MFAFDGVEASGVEVEEFVGLILSFVGAGLLESDGGGLAVIGMSSDELHEVKSDVFIASRAGDGEGKVRGVHGASGERIAVSGF